MIDPEFSSFRDPDAKVVLIDGQYYRIIKRAYQRNYDLLITSGLKNELTSAQLIIAETEVDPTIVSKNNSDAKEFYKLVRPTLIPFISYPYEWAFSQLKEAALVTLDIQLKALEKGMSLKDATAYNMQFLHGKAIHIDTTSFEEYIDGAPWKAYGQFCRHFLGPLLLHTYGKSELIKLSSDHLDGIPLKVVSYSLPKRTKWNFFVLTHIHYHAKLEQKHSQDPQGKNRGLKISKERLKGLLIHLRNGIHKMEVGSSASNWTDYYDTCSYSKEAYEQKAKIVEQFLQQHKSKMLLDMGCNEGEFSILASSHAEQVVAVDFDINVVEVLHRKLNVQKKQNVLPLVVNINEPSPAVGWLNKERASFLDRSRFDVTLALALIHHLAIGNNVPLSSIAKMFAQITKVLIVEFVPKSDKQTQRLLVTREDIFDTYDLDSFKTAFEKHFTIKAQEPIKGTERILFLMSDHA